MHTIRLTEWEYAHLRQKIACEAINWLEHKAMGHLRGEEIDRANKIIALSDKFK